MRGERTLAVEMKNQGMLFHSRQCRWIGGTGSGMEEHGNEEGQGKTSQHTTRGDASGTCGIQRGQVLSQLTVSGTEDRPPIMQVFNGTGCALHDSDGIGGHVFAHRKAAHKIKDLVISSFRVAIVPRQPVVDGVGCG